MNRPGARDGRSQMQGAPALNYELHARHDPRLWSSLAVGCAMLGAPFAARALNEGPLLDGPGRWVWPALALGGVALVWTAASRIYTGTSRGTHFDTATQTFHWWDGRAPRTRGSIPARRIGRIVIDESGDTLQIRIYGTDGAEVEGFREWCLPPRYDDWVTAVQTLFPHVDVAVVRR